MNIVKFEAEKRYNMAMNPVIKKGWLRIIILTFIFTGCMILFAFLNTIITKDFQGHKETYEKNKAELETLREKAAEENTPSEQEGASSEQGQSKK